MGIVTLYTAAWNSPIEVATDCCVGLRPIPVYEAKVESLTAVLGHDNFFRNKTCDLH